ncbi:MAG: hypothetical protein AB8G77_28290 [Rhodothermales bacterium]
MRYFLVLLFLGISPRVQAQDFALDLNVLKSPAPLLMYQPWPRAARKSAGAAIALEWLFPTAGHLYAGNWKQGVLPNVARIGGLVIFAKGLEKQGSDVQTLGLVVSLSGTIWALVSAGRTAKKYNEVKGFNIVVNQRGIGARFML